jgi:hypothetical protein
VTTRRAAFARWRRERPFWGAVLIALGGIEEFFSGQLDIGKIHIQLGLEGLQALVIPAVLVLLAILIALMPVHRIFYGIIALVLSLYSLIGVNLGGFVIGMVLSAIGGILAVAWLPKQAATAETGASEPASERAPDRPSQILHGSGHAEPVIPPSLRLADAGQASEVKTDSPRRRRSARAGVVAAIAAASLAIAGTAPQPAQAATAQSGTAQAGCVLLIICSPSSTPSPSPSSPTNPAPSPAPSTGSGGSTSGGDLIAVPGQDRGSAPAPGDTATTQPGGASDATTKTPLVALGADNDHGIFTLPSATTYGNSLQISGPSQVGIVTVPLADGSRATAIRIACDKLVIGDFHLDTKNRKEIVNLDTGGMTLSGHVVAYIDRIGTQYGNGEGLDKSLAANPLTLEALMTLLGQGHTVLGLVGAQADYLSYSSFEETASVQSTGF